MKIIILTYVYLQVSMSHPAIFPVGPKWIRMNLPCEIYILFLQDVNKLYILKLEDEEYYGQRKMYINILTNRDICIILFC